MPNSHLRLSTVNFLRRNTLIPRVTFINRCYWPDSQATGQLLTELCEFLSPRWDVTALVGQPNWVNKEHEFVRSGVQFRNGVAIHRLMHQRLVNGERFARIRNYISFTLAVRKWGRETRIDNLEGHDSRETIVCETDPFLLPLVAGPIARRRNARLVIYLQDIYPDVAIALGIARNNLAMRLLRNKLKRAYLQADCIVVLDEDMQDRLVDWGIPADRLRIVPNWMDCSQVVPVKTNNLFRKQHDLEHQFVVMHSGNLGMTQKLDVLVDAMKQVNSSSEYDQINRTTLMLVGNGGRRAELELQASGTETIQFLCYQPKESLSESLSAADLHVVSMGQEIMGCLAPSKLYGILASGTPVLAIVPKGNAVWRMVERERLGWTVEPGDRDGIARAIQAAAKVPRENMLAMGQRGRELAERLYDKKVCCEQFEAILRREDSFGVVEMPSLVGLGARG